jgi:hypothetical protein
MKNEGRELYQMFQALFTMTNLHQASLPTVRAEFYSIVQKENESILKYSSRVDIIVSTMAKLGERVSTGAWIYALGNGLRPEFKESKDGILYNKNGFNTVMSVKTLLLSEEAVLTSKSKKDNLVPKDVCTVLVIICLSVMFSWSMGSLDYSQAYLNANIDEICVMQAPISVREYDQRGKEYFWLLKKAIYGHPKASRLWAECLHNKLVELGYTQFLTDQCVYGKWQKWDQNCLDSRKCDSTRFFLYFPTYIQ